MPSPQVRTTSPEMIHTESCLSPSLLCIGVTASPGTESSRRHRDISECVLHVCGFLKPLVPLVAFSLEHGGGTRNLVIEVPAIIMFPEVLLFFSRLSCPLFSLELPFLVNFPPIGGGVQGNTVFWKKLCASQASHSGWLWPYGKIQTPSIDEGRCH